MCTNITVFFPYSGALILSAVYELNFFRKDVESFLNLELWKMIELMAVPQ